jgi:aquaporin Z
MNALIEAASLGAFMVSASLFTVLFEHPASPFRSAIPSDDARRLLIGIAMGLTAIGLIYSPWGRRSGAHMNPAVTLAMWRLKKIPGMQAVGYVAAQFTGGVAGMLVARLLLGSALEHPAVNFVVTVPGAAGSGAAFVAELAISSMLMLAVLVASNTPRVDRYAGVVAGTLVATWIFLEAPLSGMSMNPARSFASAAVGDVWDSLWIYFTAPPTGMVAAASVYSALRSGHVRCLWQACEATR